MKLTSVKYNVWLEPWDKARDHIWANVRDVDNNRVHNLHLKVEGQVYHQGSDQVRGQLHEA
jgi:hypothetical protein